ncbi:MAG: hypothetical protein C5B49_04980 [Bdellovibrio sp.]|nr:MAG: hypothetical protein C5B49_04980 [Bdellovibrio sp.]
MNLLLTGQDSLMSASLHVPQRTHVLPRMSYAQLYTQTELGEPTTSEFPIYSLTTIAEFKPQPIGIQRAELEDLRRMSGLTWKGLAALFGVSVRSVHHWLSGAKQMSDENSDLLNELVRFIKLLNFGSGFRTKKFLEEQFFNDKSIIGLLEKRDFDSLCNWARTVNPSGPRASESVDIQQLSDRLPPSLSFIATSSASTGKTEMLSQPRGRPIRLRRRPRK